ncbi:hypothetical protein [Paenibacillus hexagrammi]|uniref:Fibronectin type-III domain-containing protein n=1 Tax=Paenibacillus hexagrammi TaxID=2908839 RepID=A0ABY3SI16_9BACL|nr:hypothetical protein [Paenibacillus sp. YPD9-1]UJF32791.1 hypothetical protein L0M14_24925 [Paenibacillus sp. YPD9-1]
MKKMVSLVLVLLLLIQGFVGIAWATADTKWVTIPMNGQNSAVQFSGEWDVVSESILSQNTSYFTKDSAASFSFTFSGSGFRYTGTKTKYNDALYIAIDDQPYTRVTSVTNKELQYQQVLFEKMGLTNGPHRVRISLQQNPVVKASSVQNIPLLRLLLRIGQYRMNVGSIQIIPIVPDPPVDVAASWQDGSVRLSWKAVPMADGYQVYKSERIDDGYTIVSTNISTTEYTDANVTPSYNNSKVYYYKIAALSGTVSSDLSNFASVVVPQKVDPSVQFVTIEDSDPFIHYAGNWDDVNDSSLFSAGHSKFSKDKNASLSFTYTGKGFRYVGTRIKKNGLLLVEIDGKLTTAVLPIALKDPQYQQVLYQNENLTYGLHQVRISLQIKDDDTSVSRDFLLDSTQSVLESVYSAVTAHNTEPSSAYESNNKWNQYRINTDRIEIAMGVPESPEHLKATWANDQAELTWDVVDLAQGYQVYRSEQPDQGFQAISGIVTSPSYIDSSIQRSNEGQKTYYYKVASNAYSNQSSLSSSASVIVPQVASLSLQAAFVDSEVKLTWNSSVDAARYWVYRSEGSDSTYTRIGEGSILSGSQGTFHDTSVLGTYAADKTFRYYVTATDMGGIPLITSNIASVTISKNAAEVPTQVNALKGADGKIELSWLPSYNAKEYRVYRSTEPNEDLQNISSGVLLQETSYKDSNLPISTDRDTVVRYFVTAVNVYGVESAFSTPATIIIPKPVVLTLNTSFSSDGVNLNWNPIDGAKFYEVYRSSDGSAYRTIGAGAVMSNVYGQFTDSSVLTSVAMDTEYKYYVTALDENRKMMLQSMPVSCMIPRNTADVPEQLNAVRDTDGTVKVTWLPSSHAAGYRIYRSVPPTGKMQIISGDDLLVNTSFIDSSLPTNLEIDTVFQYQVTAVNMFGVETELSTAAAITIPKSESLTLNATVSNEGVNLNWNVINGAVEYQVNQSTDDGSTYTILGSGSVVSNVYGLYIDTSILVSHANNKTYSYYITAINNTGKVVVKSNVASVMISKNTADTPEQVNGIKNNDGSVTLTWAPSQNASEYRVYRSLKANEGYVRINGELLQKSTYTEISPPLNVEGETMLYYEVTALDAYGNESAASVPVSISFAPKVTASLILDSGDPGLIYTGKWYDLSGQSYQNGHAAYTYDSAASVNAFFKGTYFEWMGFKNLYGGMADIYVDGVLSATIDTYANSMQEKQVLFSKSLTDEIHSIKIVKSRSVNPKALGSNIPVDSIGINGTQITRLEETSSAVRYTGTFSVLNNDQISAGKALYSYGNGAQVAVVFKGTSFEWYGFKGPWNGIANVYIDNKLVGTVDSYQSSFSYMQRLFAAQDLTDSLHVFKIVNTTTRNPNSQGSNLPVDFFQIDGRVGSLIENDDASLKYNANWSQNLNDAHSGKTASYSWDLYANVQFTFTGTSVAWFGYTNMYNGIADVYIDNKYITQIDTYSSEAKFNQLLYQTSNLTNGIHTIKVERSGKKNTASSGTNLPIDYFITDGAASKISDDKDASVQYTGTWTTYSNSIFYNLSSQYTWYPSASATYSFTGTGVSVIGFKSDWGGKQSYYIDGRFAGESDTYAATLLPNVVLYENKGLSAGTHTLKIVPSGSSNPLSHGSNISIDAFVVYP